MDDFAEKIRVLRARLGVGQRELGRMFGVAGSAISNWENGKKVNSINKKKALKILAGFDDAEPDLPLEAAPIPPTPEPMPMMKMAAAEDILAFRYFTTSAAFHLTLTERMCGSLNEIAAGRGFPHVNVLDNRSVEGLRRRGLIRLSKNPLIWTLTEPGKHVHALLNFSGIF